MLLRLSVENVLCFHQEVTFSMIASEDSKHPNHVFSSSKKSGPSALKCSAIYGANGHGKTRFIEAVSFLKDLVCKGSDPDRQINARYFKLDPKGPHNGSRYVIEFRAKQNDYEYGIHFDEDRIREEWLYRIKSPKVSEKIFTRETLADDDCVMSFGKELLNSESPSKNHKMGVYLDVISEGMGSVQPFLKEAALRKVAFLTPVYNWFRYSLTPIGADSFYAALHQRIRKDKSFSEALSRFLTNADVGISEIAVKETKFEGEDHVDLPEGMRAEVGSLDVGQSIAFGNEDGSLVVISRTKDCVTMSEIETVRTDLKGEPVKFSFDEESSGTRRLVDLFPMLTHSGEDPKVFVIDELDRKLHPLLARNLLCEFLKESPNQLIYTTHNTHLLDLDILRRDEIWFVQKKRDGSSDLYSLADMKVRPDLDVRKGYLNGRFGAIPFLGNLTDLGWSKDETSRVTTVEEI